MNDYDRIFQLNLNLLVPLHELLKRRNVSAAAEAVHVTQSTMSRNLQLLRTFFDDPLLVRSGHDYILTPRAKQLAEGTAGILDSLNMLLENEFNPCNARWEMTLAVPDYVANHVVPDTFAKVLTPNMGIDLSIINWDCFARELLIAGELHLAISLDDNFAGNIHRRIIDEDRWVCVARPEHPIIKDPTSDLVGFFERTEFVDINTGGGSCKPVDLKLGEVGCQRRVRVSVRAYSTAFALVTKTDLCAIVPEHVFRNSIRCRDLAAVPLPLDLPLTRFSLWWHERFHQDVRHKWIRDNLFPSILSHPCQLGLSASGGV